MTDLLQEAIKFYAEHPVEYVIDILGLKSCTIERKEFMELSEDNRNSYHKLHPNELTWQQRDVLQALPQAIRDKVGVAVKSGHGTGKTAMEAMCLKWFMDTRPFPKIIATAPTQHQLFDVTWSELSKWHDQSLTKTTCEWKKTHFFNKKYPERWFAVARTSNKPDNMQGFHAEHLLFIVEEASGVDVEVLEVIEGTQTQEGSLVIMFGNPTQISGGFFDAFHSKRKFYITFTLNAEESPLVDTRNCEKISAKYGKDSDVYRVRVLGDFPKAEPDTLISVDRVEKAIIREIELPTPDIYNVVEIGVDVARFGDDETDIYSRIDNYIQEEDSFRNRDLMYTTGRVVQIIKRYPGKIILVNVDDTGLGGGVTDRLQELVDEGKLPGVQVFGVNNGGKSTDDTYMNVGTEMWFFMREFINQVRLPNDNDLIGQLSTRRFAINSTGKNVLEPKKDMKERGLTSPDKADACILTLRSLIYKHHGTDSWAYAC